ncbi:hypothetical protein CAEBREN_03245 [Caenorhabditis brenneri]|uniref:SET domain-containing protein n=1 Tax=Caenorhabditis brenneri TaxID=135651 RepID=G0NQ58_CAEBE|nr:hypothetical protein CAEBREN_03245 [Caenorhabditis brenneri]
MMNIYGMNGGSFSRKLGKVKLLQNENWTNERFMGGGARKINLRFLALKTFLARFSEAEVAHTALEMDDKKKKKDVKVKSDLQDYLNQYKPPDQRILITENITFNELDQIPVYCDVTEKLEDLVIPERLAFDYVDCSFVNKELEPDLVKAIKMSEKESNQIICDCAVHDLLCYENVNCPCFKTNKAMREHFSEKNSKQSAFHSLNPILISSPFNIAYENCGFACSDECACEGKCDNNSLLIPHRYLFPLEIYRNDIDMGFLVRSPVFIPAGTPVMEYTGEIVDYERLRKLDKFDFEEHKSYILKCTYEDDAVFREFLKTLNFTKDYEKLLLKLYTNKNFYIDPTNFGNVGRMAAHSCCPNLEVLRVYRKSLSPAHVSLIMVTIEDVYPGTPFSFDYGPEYAEKLKDYCKCGTFACRNNQKTDEFKNMDSHNLSLVIEKIHKLRHQAYKKEVLRK